MTTGNAAMRAVLEDLRVIDLRHDVAGPYGRQILGDMGTEVIKVERPGSGDDTRAWKRPALARIFHASPRYRPIGVELGTPRA